MSEPKDPAAEADEILDPQIVDASTASTGIAPQGPANRPTTSSQKDDLLAYYLAEVRQHPLLKPEEEKADETGHGASPEPEIPKETEEGKKEGEIKKVSESEIEEITESLETDKKNLDNSLSESKDQLQELNDSKEVILKDISNTLLVKYNQLQKTRGAGVAPLNGNCCGACYSTLPPQMVIEIQSNEIIHSCPSCSVFLFSEEQNLEE